MPALDLQDIRARLCAESPPAPRPAMRGPLGALRTILTSAPAPSEAPVRPPHKLVSPPITTDIEAHESFTLPTRRGAFGLRTKLERDLPLLELSPGATLDIAEADEPPGPRRVLLRRLQEPTETPFLPEDLMDHDVRDADHVYAHAGLPAACPTAPAQRPNHRLLALEQRLLEEHMALIEALARRRAP